MDKPIDSEDGLDIDALPSEPPGKSQTGYNPLKKRQGKPSWTQSHQ